jgi:VanZ family protein
VKRLLLLVIALILYGSLYPWQFHVRHLPANPLAMMLAAWPSGLNRWVLRDLFINVLLYVPLGVTAYLSFATRFRSAMRYVLPVLLGVGLSICMEILQLFDSARTSSSFDVACNTAGTVAGVAMASLFSGRIRKTLASRRGWKPDAAALLLLTIWFVVQMYPLFPRLSTWELPRKLATLAHSNVHPLVTAGMAAQWLSAAVLVEAVFGAGGRVLLLLLALPARFLVAAPPPGLDDFLGAGIGLCIWKVLPGGARRIRGAAIFSLLSLALLGLAPFHFGRQPVRFSWIPFAATFETEWAASARIILTKAFNYGAAVWLLARSGAGWYRAAAAVAALLAVIEVAQLRLPGRTPEITDPVLAILMMVVLRLVEKS